MRSRFASPVAPVQVLSDVDPEQLSTLAVLGPDWPPARDRDSYDIGVSARLNGLVW
jgi:hypothetical protein